MMRCCSSRVRIERHRTSRSARRLARLSAISTDVASAARSRCRCSLCAERNPAHRREGPRKDTMNRLINNAVVAGRRARLHRVAGVRRRRVHDRRRRAFVDGGLRRELRGSGRRAAAVVVRGRRLLRARARRRLRGRRRRLAARRRRVHRPADGGLNVLGMSQRRARAPGRRVGDQPDVLRRRALSALPLRLRPGVARGGRRRPRRGRLPRPRREERAQGQGPQGQARPRLGAERQDQARTRPTGSSAAGGGCSRSASSVRDGKPGALVRVDDVLIDPRARF